MSRDQQKQKGGRGGQQGGGGQKPGQQQQAEVDKKEKGGARSARNRTSRTKSGARGAWCPATIKPRAALVDKKRKRCRKGPSPRMSRRKKIAFDSFGTLMQWTNDQMSSAAS